MAPPSASLPVVTIPARRRGLSPRNRRSVRAGFYGAAAAFSAMLILGPGFPAAAAGGRVLADSSTSGGPTDVANIGKIGDVGSPESLSLPLTLLLFIGIPLLGFALGALLAFRPSKGESRRYRPGRPWTYDPVWFGDVAGLELEPQRAALPGAGGASGRW